MKERMADSDKERGFTRREAIAILTAASLAVVTGCKVVSSPEVEGTSIPPEPTTETYPTPSPEFVNALENSAQEVLDTSFAGLEIHNPGLIAGTLKDGQGAEYALFEALLPNKATGEDLGFLLIGQVGAEQKIEWLRGLVIDEGAPASEMIEFLSVTYDAENSIFNLEGPFARTSAQTGEVELFREGVWVPLLAPPPTMDAIKIRVGQGVLAAPALPTPTAEPTPTPEVLKPLYWQCGTGWEGISPIVEKYAVRGLLKGLDGELMPTGNIGPEGLKNDAFDFFTASACLLEVNGILPKERFQMNELGSARVGFWDIHGVLHEVPIIFGGEHYINSRHETEPARVGLCGSWYCESVPTSKVVDAFLSLLSRPEGNRQIVLDMVYYQWGHINDWNLTDKINDYREINEALKKAISTGENFPDLPEDYSIYVNQITTP